MFSIEESAVDTFSHSALDNAPSHLIFWISDMKFAEVICSSFVLKSEPAVHGRNVVFQNLMLGAPIADCIHALLFARASSIEIVLYSVEIFVF